MPDLRTLIDQLAAAGFWYVVLQIVLIIVATLIALQFTHLIVRGALDRLFDREASEGTAQDVPAIEVQRRRQTLEGLVYRAVRVIILVIAFLMTLQVLSLDIGPAIAGLGIVGLALSLGAQHLVRDYVAGAFVLIENHYSKGDTVAIAGVTGTVEDVSLRRTMLRDADGTVHYVPHGLIQTASNLTRSWAGVNVDVPFAYAQDLDALAAAVGAAAQRLQGDPAWRGKILEPPQIASVERLAEQGLVVRVSAKVSPLSRGAAAGVIRRLVLEEARAAGVAIGWTGAATVPDRADPADAADVATPQPARPPSPDAGAATVPPTIASQSSGS